jgi:hypothetical protein
MKQVSLNTLGMLVRAPIIAHSAVQARRVQAVAYAAALRIVRDVPALGCEGACRIYGASVIADALRTVRAEVARRQAKRARAEGAQFKSAARGLQRDGLESYGRHAEKHSRRAYRLAAKYDRTVSRFA